MKLFIVAGEHSGDSLGAELMRELVELAQEPVRFEGIGGPRMQAQGLASLFEMQELSLMGLTEILPRLFSIRARIAQTTDAILRAAPDALITIDSPEFCLRVARRARAALPGLRTIHYVAPSVWAWRPGRAARMARSIDHVLTLLPFEPPYMQAAGMSSDFVGHPVAAAAQADAAAAQRFRVRHAIATDAPLVLALPGSRRGEISRHAGEFGRTLHLLHARRPDLRVVVPTVRGLRAEVAARCADWPGAPVILEPDNADAPDEKAAAFAAADAALAASGTVSLELAAAGVPMVVAYSLNRLNWELGRRLIHLDTVTLVNLVSETRAVPEHLGPHECRAERMAPTLERVLSDPGERARQRAAMQLTLQRLGQGLEAPGRRAARSVLTHLGRRLARSSD
jgi:lipid-A-disaccharide synthase